MWLALYTNFNVFIVYYIFLAEGDRLAIINVFVFPVSDYWSKRVNFDSLKAPDIFLSPLDRAYITFPKVVKERFIFFNYFNCISPMASFLFIF